MDKKILYFGYGANSQREMMEAITGNKNLFGKPGVLRGCLRASGGPALGREGLVVQCRLVFSEAPLGASVRKMV